MSLIELYKTEEEKSCILCGDKLNDLKDSINTICDYCGKKSKISHQCNSDHLICDDCMKITAFDYVTESCLKYTGTDPIQLAVQIMNSPVIRMHGTEHHYIVPAVMLTCTYNKQGKHGEISKKLDIISERAVKETSSYCTFKAGTCGASLGTGVFLSVYNDRTPYSEDEWTEANHIIADSLKKVASSEGPRCCKRDTYLSIIASVEFMRDKYALDLPLSEPKCTFSLRNRNCGREECQFYNLSNSIG